MVLLESETPCSSPMLWRKSSPGYPCTVGATTLSWLWSWLQFIQALWVHGNHRCKAALEPPWHQTSCVNCMCSNILSEWTLSSVCTKYINSLTFFHKKYRMHIFVLLSVGCACLWFTSGFSALYMFVYVCCFRYSKGLDDPCLKGRWHACTRSLQDELDLVKDIEKEIKLLREGSPKKASPRGSTQGQPGREVILSTRNQLTGQLLICCISNAYIGINHQSSDDSGGIVDHQLSLSAPLIPIWWLISIE